MFASLGMKAGGFMTKNLAASYGGTLLTAKALNGFYGEHIDRLKASDNETMERTGRVLEAVVAGYGIGYVAPVAIIAAGHLILGNSLSAISTVGSAAILSNPLAATCAAIGALYFGDQALHTDEWEQLLASLQDGLQIGKELIVSIVGFAERTLSALLDGEALNTLKNFVVEYAGHFGRNLAQITRSVGDHAVLAAHRASALAYDAALTVGNTIYGAASNTKALASSASRSIQQHGSWGAEWMADAAAGVQERFGTVTAWLWQARNSKSEMGSGAAGESSVPRDEAAGGPVMND